MLQGEVVYSLFPEHLSGGAVEAIGDRFPADGEIHHVAGVQHAIAEQMVEFESGAVDRPVVFAVRVVQVVALRRQNGQVLHVAPRQLGTETDRTRDLATIEWFRRHAWLSNDMGGLATMRLA